MYTDCTFIQGVKKRTAPKGYITALEERVELLEKLIRRAQVAPSVDINAEIGPSFNRDTWGAVRSASSSIRSSIPSAGQTPNTYSPLLVLPDPPAPKGLQRGLLSTALTVSAGDTFKSEREVDGSDNENSLAVNDGTLTEHMEMKMQRLHLGDVTEKLFLGKSSARSLVQAALELKREVSVNANTTYAESSYPPGAGAARSKYWKPNPWEWMITTPPAVESLRFPPLDLARTLINHCFEDVMPLFPLLHRPTFERQYAEGRHWHDLGFARLLLMVCAIGSRYCDDERLYVKSSEGVIEWSSAGWMYFVQAYQMTIIASAKLVDLQIMALSAAYLEGTGAWLSVWLVNGIGLRYSADAGCHRQRLYAPTHAFANQMLKRAFWCLMKKDRELSAVFGRPVCIYDEDIDAELPLEVDDDGWDETTQAWVQPPGKPSQLTFFTQHAKLMAILAQCTRTLYAINESKVKLGFIGQEWERDKVAELDSALNAWSDALPEHLRWDQYMGATWYRQAATLQIIFHYVQITVHRPFIQLPLSSKRPLSLPSLAICSTAARSCAHILSATMDVASNPSFAFAALNSGLVLMISIWEAQRSGMNVDVSTHVAGVQTCLKYLKRWEHRNHSFGRLYDILRQTVATYPGRAATPRASSLSGTQTLGQVVNTKRERDCESTAPGRPPRLPALSGFPTANLASRGDFNLSGRSLSGAPYPGHAHAEPGPSPAMSASQKLPRFRNEDNMGGALSMSTVEPQTNPTVAPPPLPMWDNYLTFGAIGTNVQRLPRRGDDGDVQAAVDGDDDMIHSTTNHDSFWLELLGNAEDGMSSMRADSPSTGAALTGLNWLTDTLGTFNGAPADSPAFQ
ncbi:hypothetical protein FRB98_008373 [Tulasnella sp. 332]|nr:hypothetical protein FRB98_008373 [Tulasnella sp. 332]